MMLQVPSARELALNCKVAEMPTNVIVDFGNRGVFLHLG
jgi:hypothetical protein